MLQEIISHLETLPSMPKTFELLQNYRLNENRSLEELIDIINKDPMLTTIILKIVNSSFFSFKDEITNISRAINLLGESLILSIAFNSLIETNLKADLNAYNVSIEQLNFTNILAKNLLAFWFEDDKETIQELELIVFLFQIGKLILSKVSQEEYKDDLFFMKLKKIFDIPLAEKETFGITNGQVTSLLFKKWKFNNKIIEIYNKFNFDYTNTSYKKECIILNTIEKIIHIQKPLNNRSIEEAIIFATQNNLDVTKLKYSIEKTKTMFNINY